MLLYLSLQKKKRPNFVDTQVRQSVVFDVLKLFGLIVLMTFPKLL